MSTHTSLTSLLGTGFRAHDTSPFLEAAWARRHRKNGDVDRRLAKGAMLEAILESVDAHVYVKDAQWRFRYVNRQMAVFAGRPVSEVIGARDVDIFPPDVVKLHRAMDEQVLATNQRQEGEESFRDHNGVMHHYLSVKMPWRCADGMAALIGYNTEITELHELRAELLRQARTDDLTGVANRRHFFESARREFQRSQRHQLALSLIAIDVDHFKEINDTFGHPTGDRVLREVIGCFQAELRSEDLLARTGGEEFAVLLAESDLEMAGHVARRLRELLCADSPDATIPSLKITASFGVASLRADDGDFSELFARADRALYEAKHDGRNRVVMVRDQADTDSSA